VSLKRSLFDQMVYHSKLVASHAVDVLARKHHPLRSAEPNVPWKTKRAQPRNYPFLDRRQAQLAILSSNSNVARQSQLQTAAECVAVHCEDQNLFSLFKDSKRSVPLFEVIVWNPSRLELLQIDARAECAARSANYEDSRLWIIAYHLRGLIHIQRALVVHSV